MNYCFGESESGLLERGDELSGEPKRLFAPLDYDF